MLKILFITFISACADPYCEEELSGEESVLPLEEGVTFSINNGQVFSNKKEVVVSFNSPQFDSICVSDSTECTLWNDYTDSMIWHFDGEGPQYLYAWGSNDEGQNFVGPTVQTVWIDTQKPVDGILTATHRGGQINLSWSGFEDSGTGIGRFKVVYTQGREPTSCNDGYGLRVRSNEYTTHTVTPTGIYGYRVCAIDNANNMSYGNSTMVEF